MCHNNLHLKCLINSDVYLIGCIFDLPKNTLLMKPYCPRNNSIKNLDLYLESAKILTTQSLLLSTGD